MELDPAIMQRLRARYIESLPEKIERLEQLGAKVEQGDEAAAEQLRAFAHKLGGSGGSYGWPDISEAGQRLEHAEPGQRAEALQQLLDTLHALRNAAP